MKSHFCKVGTIRPNLNKVLSSKELEHDFVEEKMVKTIPLGKLSKKIA